MIHSTPDTLAYLLQQDIIDVVLPKIGKEQWQTLYYREDNGLQRFSIWCALLDESAADRAMEHDGFDLLIDQGKPGFSQTFSNGQVVTQYHRFGDDNGIRPLILYRAFNGAYPEYVEIAEEFRLYHDLAEDKQRGRLLAFDASGREIEVVLVEPHEVRARLKYLRQFQAGTGLHLAIYVDSIRYSQIALTDVPAVERVHAKIDHMTRWRRNLAESSNEEYKTLSRLLGKILLAPPPQEKAGIWPFVEEDRYVSFIIGVDKEGNEIEHSSNPSKLGNFFGANPNAPHYLTPVYFRRDVLKDYYAEPERYKIEDGRLSCLGLWSCQIDNDHDSHVVVFLGDLGRDLPYEEQLHWRKYNVAPEGGISETNFRRSILGQFADAKAPDLAFRRVYEEVSREWEISQGWKLFLPPTPGDTYLLSTIRVPVTDSQAEFDEQIGRLSKLLVDSLNEKELAMRAGTLAQTQKGGIDKLNDFLENTQFPHRQTVIQLWRNLQTLRSKGTAHRKGSDYIKVTTKLGIDLTRKSDALQRLLEEVVWALQELRSHYCKKQQ